MVFSATVSVSGKYSASIMLLFVRVDYISLLLLFHFVSICRVQFVCLFDCLFVTQSDSECDISF
jgi:hypothetical protein